MRGHPSNQPRHQRLQHRTRRPSRSRAGQSQSQNQRQSQASRMNWTATTWTEADDSDEPKQPADKYQPEELGQDAAPSAEDIATGSPSEPGPPDVKTQNIESSDPLPEVEATPEARNVASTESPARSSPIGAITSDGPTGADSEPQTRCPPKQHSPPHRHASDIDEVLEGLFRDDEGDDSGGQSSQPGMT